MEPTQREKLTALLTQEQTAVLVTQGEKWPTVNLQAFAATPDLEILFIMNETTEKFQNIRKRSEVAVLVDTRDVGTIPTFEIARAWIKGIAAEVPRGNEFQSLRALFLGKNPFEAPFFELDTMRMIRIRPKQVSYAFGLRDMFKADF
jgi:pyridoxamine 5'-phosphate oxidase-like protein